MDSFFDALPEYLELIIGYAPTLFMVVVPLAVFMAYRKTKRETSLAQKTARLLGLKYINVAEEMKAGKPGDSTIFGLLSGWSPWAMEGSYKKVPVRVELTVKSKQQRYIANSDQASVSNPTRASYSRGTIYTLSFEKPLPFDVGIHQKPEMPFGISKMLSSNSFETGDAELDGKLSISGSDPDAINQ